MNLSGKTILVTGGNGVLGRAVLACASQQGALVHAVDRMFDADSAAQQHVVDLLDPAAIADCLDRVGPIDALLNVAGGFAMGDSSWDNSAQWQAMFRINVDTLRNMLAAAVPRLLQSGRPGAIVNVGAYGALQGAAAMSAYVASKSAVMRLTESLAEELKSQRINVNAVLPTVIDTPQNRAAMPDADHTLWVAPDDLAQVMCFLASDAARAVTGSLLPVKGFV